MAARKNVHSYRSAAYVQGNTVRKLEPARVPVRRSPDEVRRPAVNHKVRRNREKALQMDLPYVIMLTIAAVCTLCLCVNYLHLQSSITTRIHTIESLESELETLKTENDALQTNINTSVIWIMCTRLLQRNLAWSMLIRIRFFSMIRRKVSM